MKFVYKQRPKINTTTRPLDLRTPSGRTLPY